MPKIAGRVVCPNCASKNVQGIGHGGYKQGPDGFGDKITLVAYQCNDCKHAWSE